MKNESMVYGIIGLLAGSLLSVLVASNAVNNNYAPMMRMMGMRTTSENMMKEEVEERGMGMGSSMNEMMDTLEGKAGDDFDKAFIEAMIVHHEGAVEMAKEAKTNATHEEIKSLADDIISAQTNEIEMMKAWQIDWGY